jgi:hypothetical protein
MLLVWELLVCLLLFVMITAASLLFGTRRVAVIKVFFFEMCIYITLVVLCTLNIAVEI